jgi:hypothetical protein
LIGGDSGDGINRPGLFESLIGSCPSCGNINAEWRPECKHCEGTGKSGAGSLDAKKPYFGGESVKRQDNTTSSTVESASQTTDDGGGWLAEVALASFWLGRDLADPRWPPVLRLILSWIIPASYAWGILSYIYEVIRNFRMNIFEGLATLFVAWLAIPVYVIIGTVAMFAVWGATKLFYHLTRKDTEI